MKKRLLVFGIVLMLMVLAGCSTKPETAKNTPTAEATVKQEKASADNKSIKDVAVPADFVEINSGNWKGKSVVVTGEISAIDLEGKMNIFPNCMISQAEGDGYGMYLLLVPGSSESGSLEGRKEGDTITVYGTVYEPDSTGLPQILAVSIE
ncbi:MAG: hypothetical protein RR614_13090 [Eubacterium sp.]